MKREITYYCMYDKRKKRQNAMEKVLPFVQLSLA